MKIKLNIMNSQWLGTEESKLTCDIPDGCVTEAQILMSQSKYQIDCDYDNLKSNLTLIRFYHYSIVCQCMRWGFQQQLRQRWRKRHSQAHISAIETIFQQLHCTLVRQYGHQLAHAQSHVIRTTIAMESCLELVRRCRQDTPVASTHEQSPGQTAQSVYWYV